MSARGSLIGATPLISAGSLVGVAMMFFMSVS